MNNLIYLAAILLNLIFWLFSFRIKSDSNILVEGIVGEVLYIVSLLLSLVFSVSLIVSIKKLQRALEKIIKIFFIVCFFFWCVYLTYCFFYGSFILDAEV